MEDESKIFRERAIHARLGAREAINPKFRAVFERLAESYEAKARDAEWLKPSYRDHRAEAREPSMPRRHAAKPEA